MPRVSSVFYQDHRNLDKNCHGNLRPQKADSSSVSSQKLIRIDKKHLKHVGEEPTPTNQQYSLNLQAFTWTCQDYPKGRDFFLKEDTLTKSLNI